MSNIDLLDIQVRCTLLLNNMQTQKCNSGIVLFKKVVIKNTFSTVKINFGKLFLWNTYFLRVIICLVYLCVCRHQAITFWSFFVYFFNFTLIFRFYLVLLMLATNFLCVCTYTYAVWSLNLNLECIFVQWQE